MCNLSEGIYDRAELKTLIAAVGSAMKNGKWSLQKAMEFLDISPEKQKIIKEALAK
ncbi:MAG: hypothetical protein K6F01_09950 [Selenomonas sp.]|uniref:hypothetical protein n=1 Tax=Selenomonas sp. TaxID=2053611 RepID=UPI0025D2B374|nr:hypothetical protein [Selenomonas sp.]MCR5439737.1 hypothetical protein [Selenomonas sp.]